MEIENKAKWGGFDFWRYTPLPTFNLKSSNLYPPNSRISKLGKQKYNRTHQRPHADHGNGNQQRMNWLRTMHSLQILYGKRPSKVVPAVIFEEPKTSNCILYIFMNEETSSKFYYNKTYQNPLQRFCLFFLSHCIKMAVKRCMQRTKDGYTLWLQR